jgi:transcriptional regulator with PAS, ATPase and Fis domain
MALKAGVTKQIPPLIGVSQNINRIREMIKHVAHTGLSVVISGESGVGKEVVAQNLYRESPRVGKPFVKINCAALPEGLLESELFGYEVGAFTGAGRRKRGKFELAHGGVLFLDEIGDMSLQLQSKLLHVLQSGEFARLGSETDIRTDTWVIAATNHDLSQDVKQEKFREDLYYRLNIIKINIDPLRNRPEDIPHLIEHFLEQYAPRFSKSAPTQLGAEVIAKMQSYHWPGNVRELQNALKRIIVLGPSEEVLEELFHSDAIALQDSHASNPSGDGAYDLRELIGLDVREATSQSTLSLKEIKKKTLARVEKDVISHVLLHTGWNRSKATKILKISYKTLLNKIKELDIKIPSNF